MSLSRLRSPKSCDILIFTIHILKGGVHLAKIVAVANQKGGVGKTTTAVNLAAALHSRGLKTLLLDLDPQSNASTGYGISRAARASSIYDAILGKTDAESLIRHTPFGDCIPANMALAGANLELAAESDRAYRLRTASEPLRALYDYIIIDCPPSLELLTVNALCAADSVLVPLQCEYYALEGLGELVSTIRMVRKGLNNRLEIEGILFTMFDSRTRLALQVVGEVKKHFPDKVYKTTIARNVRLSEAPSHGKPVMYYDKFSKGAENYQRLAEEFLERNA